MSEKVILAFNWRICIYYIYKYNMEILNKNNVYKPNWSELHSFGFLELLSRFHRSKKQKPFPWYSLPFSVPTRTLPAGSQFDGISCSGGFGESGGFPSDLDQTLTIEGCHINSIPMFWNDVLTAYIDIYIYMWFCSGLFSGDGSSPKTMEVTVSKWWFGRDFSTWIRGVGF